MATLRIRRSFLAQLLVYSMLSCMFAKSHAASDAPPGNAELDDQNGSHDFDLAVGQWKADISRRSHPLSGSGAWVSYTGKTLVTPVWNGRAQLVQLEADGPAGRLELLSLRLYNPEKREWSLYYGNSTDGSLTPPVTGRFRNGRGEFYGNDQFNGRAIRVRQTISAPQKSLHLEQAFSADQGRTWEVNFLETLTRLPATEEAHDH